jgi:aryl-alcohol dehydrogenase-like predicted oxidoreductase
MVSALGLGCNNIGVLPDRDSEELIRHALDIGVNFFDTADVYAGGRSEEILGRTLKAHRNHVYVATKFGHPSTGSEACPPGSRTHVMRSVEGSLSRLRTEWIDLYQLHFPVRQTPLEETLEALEVLRRSGKIRFAGCSNFAAADIAESLAVAGREQFEPFVAWQGEYHLLARGIERDILPLARRHELGVLPAFPLASGVLAEKYQDRKDAEGSVRSRVVRDFASRFLHEKNLEGARRLGSYAKGRGWQLAPMAIAWLLADVSVASVIAGASKPAQLDVNLGALSIALSPDALRDIDAITNALE